MRPTLSQWAARGTAAFCVVFALFQAALAAGAPFGQIAWGGHIAWSGHIAWGGSSAVLPAQLRWMSLGATAYLLFAAAVMEVRAGDWGKDLPRLPFLIFNILLAGQLALNSLANLSTQTAGERYGMGAASAVGCMLSLLALKPARRGAAL